MTPIVRRMEERWPGLQVEVVRTSWTDQVQALRDGRLDASFARRPFDDTGLTVLNLYAEPRLVALPASHPHAGSAQVLLADLADDVLLQPLGWLPEWPGRTLTPPTPDHSPTMEEKLELVAAGRGIVILPASTTRYYTRPDVAYAQVSDLPDTEISLVIEARRHTGMLADLLQIAALIPAGEYSGEAHAETASTGAEPVLDG